MSNSSAIPKVKPTVEDLGLIKEAANLVRHLLGRVIAFEKFEKPILGRDQIGKGGMIDQIIFVAFVMRLVIGLVRLTGRLDLLGRSGQANHAFMQVECEIAHDLGGTALFTGNFGTTGNANQNLTFLGDSIRVKCQVVFVIRRLEKRKPRGRRQCRKYAVILPPRILTHQPDKLNRDDVGQTGRCTHIRVVADSQFRGGVGLTTFMEGYGSGFLGERNRRNVHFQQMKLSE